MSCNLICTRQCSLGWVFTAYVFSFLKLNKLERPALYSNLKNWSKAEIKPMTSGSEVNRSTNNKARTGPRSAAWFLKSGVKFKIFNVTITQLIECLAGVPKDPGLISGWEGFFHLNSFSEEMREMEKNNNSGNSLVFGRWPQTTRPYLQDVEL